MNPTQDQLNKLDEDVRKLWDALSGLKAGGDGAMAEATHRKSWPVPRVVSEAELVAVTKRVNDAIADPDQGLDQINKQYVQPVLELIRSSKLSFDASAALPPVVTIDVSKLGVPNGAVQDESSLGWNGVDKK